jgi:hypothetical protein
MMILIFYLVGGKNCSWQLHEDHNGRFAGSGSKIGPKPPSSYHWKANIKGYHLIFIKIPLESQHQVLSTVAIIM